MSFLILAYDIASGALGAALGASRDVEDCRLIGASGKAILAVQGPRQGPLVTLGAALVRQQLDSREVATRLLEEAGEPARHQILLVDARGRTVAHSGRECAPTFGHTEGMDHVAGGNGMVSANVVGAMSLSFERSAGDPLWERLLLALESGERAGGNVSTTRDARLLVYRPGREDPLDLAVQDCHDPVRELRQQVAEWLSRG